MNSELAKVKAKIKALAAKTVEAGCSEHEALHAAEMVGRLLDQYNLSMDEIDIREEVCVLGEVPAGSKRRMPVDGAVVPIARFCDVKTWHAKRPDGTAVYCSTASSRMSRWRRISSRSSRPRFELSWPASRGAKPTLVPAIAGSPRPAFNGAWWIG